MKRKLLSVFLSAALLIGCLPMTAIADTGVAINEANFPDPVFRDYISSNFDDGDGVLTADEIANAKHIDLSGNDELTSLVGIKYFTSLKWLECYNFRAKNLKSIDVSGMTSLQSLDCAPSGVTTLNVSSCANLKTLCCNSCPLTSLNVDGCTSLKSLKCAVSGVTTLNVSSCARLETLNCACCPLTSLNVDGCTYLSELKCYGCQLTSLNVSSCTELMELDCYDNNISSLDLRGMSNLQYLNVSGNPLKNVFIGNSPSLCESYLGYRNKYTDEFYWKDGSYEYFDYDGNLLVDPDDTIYGCTQRTPDPMPEFPAAEKDIGTFVLHAYMTALGRTADQAGFVNWVTNLELGKVCGAQLGYGFLFSQEYTNKNRSNTEFVDDLYSVFFGRNRGDGEGDSWINELDADIKSREQVFNGFVNSTEYYNLCKEYGVTAGYYVSGVPSAQQGGVNGFVSRLYRVCLGRLPDQGGQQNWVSNLISGGTTGASCVHGFLFSAEFTNKNLNDLDFVAYTYRAFFGREADASGLKTWMDVLGNGGTREDVFNGFVNSQEFRNLCSSYGINP